MSKNKFLSFEDALAELEQLVSLLEQDTDSLKSFEPSVTLPSEGQNALQTTEQKIHILTTKNGTSTLEPYTDE